MSLQGKFCDKPFRQLEIGNYHYGQIDCRVCCPTWLPEAIGRYPESSLADAWNSNTAQAIRASIHDGSFRYCDKNLCPAISNGTLPDKIDIADKSLREIIDQKKNILDEPPQHAHFASDRSCNLSCPSCRDEVFMLRHKRMLQTIQAAQQELIRFCQNSPCEFVIAIAGDPFASKTHRKLLTEFDGTRFPHVRFRLVTNGLLLDHEMWQRLGKIHKNISQINVSVDAASAETYRVVRRGGDFVLLKKNLNFLASERSRGNLQRLQLDFVVQAENFRELPEFIKMADALDADSVFLQRITNWGTFSEQAFQAVDIFNETHPYHEEFLNILNDPALQMKFVDRGNCGPFFSLPPNELHGRSFVSAESSPEL